MLIPHVTGNNTDTAKLADVEAMIMEKSEELRKICFDNNRQCLVLVDAKGMRNGGFFSFWNLKEDDAPKVDKDGKWDPSLQLPSFAHMLHGVNVFVMELTNGQVGLANRFPPPTV